MNPDALAQKWLCYAMRLAHDYANKHGNDLREDLCEACNVSLYKAVNKYDPGRGMSFKSYLVMCCRREMHEVLCKRAGIGRYKARGRVRVQSETDVAAADHDFSLDCLPCRPAAPRCTDFEQLMIRLDIPPQARPLVRRIYWDGISCASIARGLGVSPAMLNARLRAVLKAVKQNHVYTERSC